MITIGQNFFNHDAQAGGFFPRAHVGISVKDYGESGNILIEGIRGTGKTHLLKKIETEYFDSFLEKRILPIYVSIAQISEHAKRSPDDFRVHLYTHIVKRTTESLITYKDYLKSRENSLAIALRNLCKLFHIEYSAKVFENIEHINKIADELRFELDYSLNLSKIAEEKCFEQNLKHGGNVAIEVNQTVTAKGGYAAEKSEKCASKNGKEYMFIANHFNEKDSERYIIEFFRQVQVVLNVKHCLLLIDEISECPYAAQIEIFRLFKMIRGARPALVDKENLCFFIGTVYPAISTYYPTKSKDGFSFEPGQDCGMKFIQWDESDTYLYLEFFREMTLARAKVLIDERYSWHTLLIDLFDNEDVFKLGAFCSHGIPRRYWEILRHAYSYSNGRISETNMDNAIQEVANTQILSQNRINENDFALLHSITRLLNGVNTEIRSKNNLNLRLNNPISQNTYFSVSRSSMEIVSNLLINGIVHDKSRMKASKRRSRPVPIYTLDLAITYTQRIIPPKGFVAVVERELPKCADNDYPHAPLLREKSIAITDIQKTVETVPQQNSDVEITGQIKILKGSYGFIIADQIPYDIFFHTSNLEAGYLECNPGDKVSFKIDSDHAVNVNLLEKALPITGIICRLDNNYSGYIQIEDEEELFFYLTDVLYKDRFSIKEGTRVRFYLGKNKTGKLAQKIVIMN